MKKNRIINKLNSHKCASGLMNLRDRINLIEKYKATSKTIEFVNDLFTQNDTRYLEFYDDVFVAGFIDNKAIIVEEKLAPDNLESINLDKNDLEFVNQPQKDEKIVAIQLFKTLGLEFVGTERRFKGGEADVLGRSNEKTIAVECGPCRINKAIDYLEHENTELWLIPVDFWQNKKFFVVSRGPNWEDFLDFHRKHLIEGLKTVIEVEI